MGGMPKGNGMFIGAACRPQLIPRTPLCANVAETPSIPIISERGGMKIRHGDEETFKGSPCGYARCGIERSRA